ncbi:MAG: phosphoserine phosphatase SerB [Succinivibrio sp.]
MSLVFASRKDPAFSPEKSAREALGSVQLLREASSGDHKAAIFRSDSPRLGDEGFMRSAREGDLGFDLIAAPSFPTLNKPGAIALDMDMTSVQIEGIDEIARRLGVYDEVAAITAGAMRGGLDFASSLRKRVAMLKGGSASVIEDVRKIMTETGGLDALMKAADRGGWKKGICSGGFTQLICVLEKKYGLDMVRANTLEIEGGVLTGRVSGAITDARAKAQGVRDLIAMAGAIRENSIVLGDGANDLMMMEEAGLGIAFHAKPLVRDKAPSAINHSDLTAVALLLELSSEI